MLTNWQIDVDHEFAESLMVDLNDAAAFIRSQVAANNHKWLHSLKQHSWAKGIQNFSSDLRHHTQYGTRQGTTWGTWDKTDARMSKTVMGFILNRNGASEHEQEEE